MQYMPDADIFKQDVDLIVNPVNCHVHLLKDGYQKGLAGAFEKRFPGTQEPLRRACRDGLMKPGMVQVVRLDRATGARRQDGDLLVANLATKDHWRDPSRPEWVEGGLRRLATLIETRNIRSVAVPKLGAGLGRLSWETVRDMTVKHLSPLAEKGVDIRILGEGPQQMREVSQGGAARRAEVSRPEGTVFIAGIGARNTAPRELQKMHDVALGLARTGAVLRSGGAEGCDTVCESAWDSIGGEKEIFLSWEGMNGRKSDGRSVFCYAYEDSDPEVVIARSFYHRSPLKPEGDTEKWASLGRGGRAHMTRNTNQVLGPNVGTSPVTNLILCATKDGRVVGGTGQALRLAEDRGIPVLNLGDPALRIFSAQELVAVGQKMIEGATREEAVKAGWVAKRAAQGSER